MFSSSAKKPRSKKTGGFRHLDKDFVALELRKWALEEMCFRPQGRHVNSRIPSVEEFKMLCRGSMIEIWSHVIQHVRSAQNVQKVKGNLKLLSIQLRLSTVDFARYNVRLAETRSGSIPSSWHRSSLFHNKKKTSKDDSQSEDSDHLGILRRNTELRTQIGQVEKDLCHLEKEILQIEKSLDEVSAKTSHWEKRCALLTPYSKQCLEKAKILDEFGRRIEGRTSHYKEIRRKSSDESMFFQKPSITGLLTTSSTNEQTSSARLESACTRSVRETCEAIGSFLHLLHHGYMTGESPRRSYTDRNKTQLWTSVENVLSQHAAPDIYASLARTALDSASNLQELTSRIDVRKDAEDLKFKYENSGQLSDTSSPRPLLLSVHQLIEEGQAAHFRRFLDTEKAKNEIFKGQKLLKEFQENMETRQKVLHGNNSETLAAAQSLYRTELELVASKATAEYIDKEIKQLETLRLSKQGQLDTLYAKYRQIQDFEEIVQTNQNMIQVLVKHNSDAKTKIAQRQTEIIKYAQDIVCTHEAQIAALSSSLSDSLSKETAAFLSLSLHRVLFSAVDGDGRIPVYQLSINRLETSQPSTAYDMVSAIVKSVDFHNYKAPDCLLQKVVETKDEVTAMKESLKYNKDISNSLNEMDGARSSNDKHVKGVKEAVVERERIETEQILPKVQESFSKATKALSEYISAKDTVNLWWEQPAQHVVPWITVDGMNMRQWKDQWTVMATRLRQLQTKQ